MTRKQISRIPEPIARALRGYRTRWKTVGTLSGLLAAAAVLVATVSAAILADRLLRLSFGTRAILLAAIVGTAGFVAVRWGVLRLLKRMRYREAARRLGGRYPDAEEDLVSAVESHGAGRSTTGRSGPPCRRGGAGLRPAGRHPGHRPRPASRRGKQRAAPPGPPG
jgi:hypothetical protein